MTAPRVFISYSHDSEAHKQRVLELANRMRAARVDAWLDRYSPPPPENWDLWIERQFEAARWIILVCTETYRRRFDRKEESGSGRGVAYEAMLTRAGLYDDAGQNRKIIPVVFDRDDLKHLPRAFVASSRYVLPDEFDRLLRHIAGAPEVDAPPLGGASDNAVEGQPKLPRLDVQSAGVPDEPINGEEHHIARATATSSQRSSQPAKSKRILIVAASPARGVRLALGKELREINLMLRRASPEEYEVQVLSAATEKDLRQEILEFEPNILHFCGHGTNAGPLLDTEDGQDETLPDGDALGHWLQVAIAGQKRPLELAVLNFCHSSQMLNALADVADVVVGPTQEISDSQAVLFSSAFYMSLARGCTSTFSYHLGCAALEMSTSILSGPAQPYGIRCRNISEAALAGPRPSGRIPSSAYTLAFIASEPPSTSWLRLDRELRAISKVLRGKRVSIEQSWATRVCDFLQTLLEIRPSIVHLAGPATPTGNFIFETDRESDLCEAPSSAIAKVMSLFHADIQCAVLMFDTSSELANQICDIVDYIISLKGAVQDTSCIDFSEEFYRMLSFGRTIPQAYRAAASIVRSRADRALFSLQGRKV